jgi:hypothetical protein
MIAIADAGLTPVVGKKKPTSRQSGSMPSKNIVLTAGATTAKDVQERVLTGVGLTGEAVGPYTKIHGKYYDLTKFADSHPGGEIALQHAYGRDATVLFESHHPFSQGNKTRAVLAKFEIAALPPGAKLMNGEDTIPEFNYDTPFATELKAEVTSYFESEAKRRGVSVIEATKAPINRYITVGAIVALRYAVLFNLSPQSSWLYILLLAAVTWLNDIHTFHDGCHFAMSTNQKVNQFMSHLGYETVTPLDWRVQHNIGHHSYTNVDGKDPGRCAARFLCCVRASLSRRFADAACLRVCSEHARVSD